MHQILLVDDESYVIDDLEIAFPWEQYRIERIHKAYSGMQALSILDEQTVDIVITDISMPVMNGLELIRQIKALKPNLPCILLTGYAEFEYAKEATKYGVVEYLLKPLDVEKLAACLEKTVLSIEDQIRRTLSYELAMNSFRQHLPSLRDRLLNQLIEGNRYATDALNDKLEHYQLPFHAADEVQLVLVRLEEHFTRHTTSSLQLFEYAVTNIACELFNSAFHTWHCRDHHDYLVFVLKPTELDASIATSTPASDVDVQPAIASMECAVAQEQMQYQHQNLTHLSLQLHHNVNEYLKGGISVILSHRGTLHSDIREMYEQAISALKKQVGNGTGYFLSIAESYRPASIRSLHILYEPPTFNHLLETGQWAVFKERLDRIKQAYSALPEQTEEHLDEIRIVLLSAYHYIAHKNHTLLSDLVGNEWSSRPSFRSVSQLTDWAELVLDRLRAKLEEQSFDEQHDVIQQIQTFVSSNLHSLSLQSIADHVSLHPVYVSKLFKQIQGISLSEYILSVKMDLALYLLNHTQDRVYEISEKLGYANSQYFIKVFRDKFGMTPQEYREQ
ncbi:response regulator [Paenibacillus barcinonensis]|uniref:Response regulator n=1 Tax=Paenibacillus barcinonensis TaxID=198119 RepID=A0A2V4UZC0_PAEBA|nr:response regulator [Paenibacillus barcinonensis]PYE45443.1 two-component system response regulator YesN [Paenibacillus barcinonensis]QKS55258.1 response regulator [Paenibacillus barcinonensis]